MLTIMDSLVLLAVLERNKPIAAFYPPGDALSLGCFAIRGTGRLRSSLRLAKNKLRFYPPGDAVSWLVPKGIQGVQGLP